MKNFFFSEILWAWRDKSEPMSTSPHTMLDPKPENIFLLNIVIFRLLAGGLLPVLLWLIHPPPPPPQPTNQKKASRNIIYFFPPKFWNRGRWGGGGAQVDMYIDK
jgi:hypothetical protein